MSDPIEAGIQRHAQETLAAALRRIPQDGRWVVLRFDGWAACASCRRAAKRRVASAKKRRA